MQTHSSIFSILRFSEFIALISLSTTVFLFLHTRDLAMQLDHERTRHEDDLEAGQEEVAGTALNERERIEYFGQVSPVGSGQYTVCY